MISGIYTNLYVKTLGLWIFPSIFWVDLFYRKIFERKRKRWSQMYREKEKGVMKCSEWRLCLKGPLSNKTRPSFELHRMPLSAAIENPPETSGSIWCFSALVWMKLFISECVSSTSLKTRTCGGSFHYLFW